MWGDVTLVGSFVFRAMRGGAEQKGRIEWVNTGC